MPYLSQVTVDTHDPEVRPHILMVASEEQLTRMLGLSGLKAKHLTEPLLNDLRPEVAIATLRLLQRRQEPEILAAIDRCIQINHLPGVAEMAIQALGCIGSPLSCELLIGICCCIGIGVWGIGGYGIGVWGSGARMAPRA